MATMFRTSEAASLGLHAMSLLARRSDELTPTKEIAAALHASEAHLSKVLQRLAKVGLVESTRGPKGGFRLARPGGEISLLEVYETIEGPLGENGCLLSTPICGGQDCIFGDLLSKLNRELREYLARTKLSEVVSFYGGARSGDSQDREN